MLFVSSKMNSPILYSFWSKRIVKKSNTFELMMSLRGHDAVGWMSISIDVEFMKCSSIALQQPNWKWRMHKSIFISFPMESLLATCNAFE